MGIKLKKGFTLIEIIVTFGIIAIVLPALFSIIFVIFNEEVKVLRLSEVKRQGDFALSSIENNIRNFGYKIYSEASMTNEQCTSASPTYGPVSAASFYIRDNSASILRYRLSSDKIASDSAYQDTGVTYATVYLTNDKVTISDFFLSCRWVSDYVAPLITATFTVSYKTSSLKAEEIASMNYRTSVRPRTY